MLKLYNTLTRSIEEFHPLVEKQVGMYTCGPTVYDRAHIGNMRTYIMSDTLVRTLRFLGYEVNSVMNITDIEDKMIARAEREGISLSELAVKFEDILFDDLALLNIEPADTYPRATEHFPEMKSLLNTLIEKEYAYEKDGEVYYDISKFKDYGKLSLLDKREIKPGARVAVDEYNKDDASDFVLWKLDDATKAHTHAETKGGGRPGWHLECSAMSMKYLGPTLDIHAGGVDLLFPHHENEIAQSEAATEKPFVKYFVHCEFLLIDGKKMAKSAGTFYTLGDIQEKGIDPLAYRYLLLTSHYRSKLNFTWDSLAAAAKALESVRQLTYRAQNELTDEQRRQYLERGMAALENDLDTPQLLAILHEADNYDLWLAFEPVLGLGLVEAAQIPTEVETLFQKRQQAREAKDFVTADELRGQIEDRGYLVEDTATGSRLVAK